MESKRTLSRNMHMRRLVKDNEQAGKWRGAGYETPLLRRMSCMDPTLE